jgi:purine nucleosidase
VLQEPPGSVTLVPTAALTNIAVAVRKEPRIAERVAEVVLMGGAVAGGNRTAAAESNIVTDPEAAHIVFGERWPVTMVGLELTHQALATPEVVDRIVALGTAPARFVLEVLDFFGGTYRAEESVPDPPLHDLCAVARVIDPSVMTTRRAPIRVELTGTHTRGMTIADLREPAPPDCHTQVAVDLDHVRFWDLVVDALERIGEP